MPDPLAQERVGTGSRSGETHEPIPRMPPLPFPSRGSGQRLAKPLLSPLRRPPGAGGGPGANAGPPLPLSRPPRPLKELVQALSNGPLTLPVLLRLPPSPRCRPETAAPVAVQAPPWEGFRALPSVVKSRALDSPGESAWESTPVDHRSVRPLRASFQLPFPGRLRLLPGAPFRGPDPWRARCEEELRRRRAPCHDLSHGRGPERGRPPSPLHFRAPWPQRLGRRPCRRREHHHRYRPWRDLKAQPPTNESGRGHRRRLARPWPGSNLLPPEGRHG